ncbi:MAG: ABC transporter permease subunit [Armatimonadetes bacterium]|nr:ABC transporter permease subunit [Armatimonadota bacterium]
MNRLLGTLKNLFVENPMLCEVGRFQRRYLSLRSPVNMAGLAIIGVLSALFLLEAYTAVRNPFDIMLQELALLTFFVPMLGFRAIAGEREKRTWDILLVAPITKSQIVVGKFLAAVFGIIVVMALGHIPVLITIVNSQQPYFGYMEAYPRRFETTNIPAADAICLSFSLFAYALTLFFSARVKRSLTALGAAYGVLILLLLTFGAAESLFGGFAFLNPFVSLGYLGNQRYVEYPYLTGGWQCSFIYTALTILLVTWTCRTLTFAENEVRFLPKLKKHARTQESQ